nr:hypothetical protein [Tanacetum cinerariifolium]
MSIEYEHAVMNLNRPRLAAATIGNTCRIVVIVILDSIVVVVVILDSIVVVVVIVVIVRIDRNWWCISLILEILKLSVE